MPLVLPGRPEADVRETDAPPGEQRREPGQGQQPGEDGGPVRVQVDVGEEAEGQHDADAAERPAGAVDIRKGLGGVALLREGGEGAAPAVHARDADGDDRDEDDDVHEGVEAAEAGVLADQDEGRGADVGVGAGAEQVRVVRVDEQADEEQAEDVEEGDAPEDLLDGAGQGPGGVAGLGGRQADQLGAAEGEGGRDEDGAEAAEAVLERAGVVPEPGAPVLAVLSCVRAAAEDEDQGDEHEDDGSGELEAGGPELLFGVAYRAEDVDDDDQDEEHGDPDCDGDVGVPVLDR